jgi:hypothetical protein
MRAPASWEYKDEQVPDALSYTFDDLEGALPASYTDDRWRLIAEHLAEHLQNGLTQGPASSPSPKKATLLIALGPWPKSNRRTRPPKWS